ncbi:zinc-binding alcohol dehydrogenase family protein [Secundilactobacillus hailunensis]|uniref:Zinc-binding alcohol dehydrogenase family protein n=1 Tax=Secundilactobacillus hailunensis TaxID=2559923 RepID=A0ABW1T9M9_9LACO|nr:zinc-binding alcohol dehydrogenase family protein [Secundilactobacillus hailunensis]
MKAAIVTDFKQAPVFQKVALPEPNNDEVKLRVLAASVNQRVLMQANGSHYTSDQQLPLIPGVDGAGETADGQKVYFVATHPGFGTLAEETLVDHRAILPLADDVDPAVVAATVNPALSSYMAIKGRLGVDAIQGKKVMILGATGNAGKLAVTISRHFGAQTIIAIGRNEQALAETITLGADQTINLQASDLKAQLADISDVDVVLDYLWGDVTKQVMMGIITQRTDHAQALKWVEIGSLAGGDFALPSAALRSTNLTLLGSGQGSLSMLTMLKEMPGLLKLISNKILQVPVTRLTLSTVHENWPSKTTNRIVFIP